MTVTGIISSWVGEAHHAPHYPTVLEIDSSLNHLSPHPPGADVPCVPLLEPRALDRINTEYSAVERDAIAELLVTYSGPEPDRVVWDILELSGGDSDKLLHFLHCAERDYRDVLYWAEYYDNDPILKDRDPRQLVNELLAVFKKTT